MQVPSLDFGYFQNIVDEGEQMLAAAVDDVQRLPLAGGDIWGAPHQAGETENCVERGAQLVTHIGQEGTLGLVGCLRGIARLKQFSSTLLKLCRALPQPLNQKLLFRDILKRSQEPRHIAVFIAHRLTAELSKAGLSPWEGDAEQALERCARGRRLVQHRAQRLPVPLLQRRQHGIKCWRGLPGNGKEAVNLVCPLPPPRVQLVFPPAEPRKLLRFAQARFAGRQFAEQEVDRITQRGDHHSLIDQEKRADLQQMADLIEQVVHPVRRELRKA